MTDIAICNRALQKLGAGTITALSDGTIEGDACGLVYEDLRDATLAANPWNFAIKRAVLTVLGTTPAWGFKKEYTVPADSIRIVKIEDLKEDEWSVENGKILTDQNTSINVLYIYKNTDVSTYSRVFIEAFAARMAWELTEHFNQSNTKKHELRDEYIAIIMDSRRTNALEGVPNALDNGSWFDSRV